VEFINQLLTRVAASYSWAKSSYSVLIVHNRLTFCPIANHLTG
jgi:hypothetical protein